MTRFPTCQHLFPPLIRGSNSCSLCHAKERDAPEKDQLKVMETQRVCWGHCQRVQTPWGPFQAVGRKQSRSNPPGSRSQPGHPISITMPALRALEAPQQGCVTHESLLVGGCCSQHSRGLRVKTPPTPAVLGCRFLSPRKGREGGKDFL